MTLNTQETAGSVVQTEGISYRPVARKSSLRLGHRHCGIEASYHRPHRVEVHRADTLIRTVAVPDRELQIRMFLFGIIALAVLVRRRRGSR